MAPAIDIRPVEAIEGGVAVTVRVFETGFGESPYSGTVSVLSGLIGGETARISGTAGAGTDADTVRVEFTGFGVSPDEEITVEAILGSGDSEVGTFRVGEGPGPVEPPSGGGGYTVTDCGAEITPGGNLSVPFTVDGDGGGSFTSVVYVGGQRVHESSWSIVNPPTSYEDVVDSDDLPIGENMSVEIEVDGEVFRCGAVTVEGDTGGGGGGDEPPVDQPVIEPSDLSIVCLGTSVTDSVSAGSTINPLFQVENPTNTDLTAEVEALVDGQSAGRFSVDVPAGGATGGRQEIRLEQTGERQIGFRIVSVA